MNYRKLLHEAIASRHQAMTLNIIRLAMSEGQPVEEWTDLHFSAMLLLAAPAPKKETRGRPKAYSELERRWYGYACVVKSHLTGESFTALWDDYASYVTRPVKPNDQPLLLAKFIKLAIRDASTLNGDLMRDDEITNAAIKAMKLFKLSESDIDQVITSA